MKKKLYLSDAEIEILLTLLKDSQKKLIKEACTLPEERQEELMELVFKHGRLEVDLTFPSFTVLKEELGI